VVQIHGRKNAAGTTYVAWRYLSDKWQLTAVVAGSSTSFNAYALDTFSNGAVYSLVCGTGVSANRIFGIMKNGALLPLTNLFGVSIGTTYTDSGNVSQMGASYRGGGFVAYQTGKVSQWTMVDNAPPAAVGSGFRAYASSTPSWASFNPTAASNNPVSGWSTVGFPASTFGTTQYITSDMSYTSSTNTLTVTVAGWYQIVVSHRISTSGTIYTAVGFFKNGTFAQSGNGVGWTTGNTPVVQGSFLVYCAAGDTLQPGLVYSTGASFTGATGDASGSLTYWEVAFMNRGQLS
jgi:hypothetical protein